ncbi:MAG: hypothetical protein AAFW89_13130, partial [Bacteroidota bacterium]
KVHKNDAEELISEVRTWFSECGRSNVISPTTIWNDYNKFYADLYLECTGKGFSQADIERLPVPEFISAISDWNLLY